MTSDLEPGLAGAADLDEIAEVLRQSFPDNPKADPVILRWQYVNPFGPPTIAVLRDEGRIVAQFAAIPYPAIVAGEPATIARTGDAAILPSHRGRGLFPVLARHLYDACAAAGMPVAFSYPNDLSVRGLERVGWTPLGTMRAHVLVTSDTFVAQRLRLPAPVVGVGRRALFRRPSALQPADEVETAPLDADALWTRLAPAVTHGVRRDLAWLRWRYVQRPGKSYRWWAVREHGELTGLAVAGTRRIGRGTFADVLELLAVDGNAARALVAGLQRDLGPDVDGLTLAALVGSPLSTMVLGTGFRLLPRALEEQRLRAGLADTTGAHAELLTAPWSLQWGDMDHL